MGNTNKCCERPADLLSSEDILTSERAVRAQVLTTKKVQGSERQLNRSFSDDDDQNNEAEIQKKLLRKATINKKKMGISAEAYGRYNQQQAFVPPVIPKTKTQINLIRQTLKRSFMFTDLDEKDQEIVIEAMAIKTFQPNDVVIRQGDQGNELYIVADGSLKCEKVFPGKTEATFLKNYGPNDVFGELSLLYNTPRAASIVSTSESTLFSLDRETFNHIVKSSTVRKLERYESFLKKVPLLQALDDYERSKLCDVLRTETYYKGDYIIRQGEEGHKFYLLQEGEVQTLKSEDGGPQKLVYTFKENDYFGELALYKFNKRQASCVVSSPKAVVVSLDKESFKRLLGPLEEVLEKKAVRYNLPN